MSVVFPAILELNLGFFPLLRLTLTCLQQKLAITSHV